MCEDLAALLLQVLMNKLNRCPPPPHVKALKRESKFKIPSFGAALFSLVLSPWYLILTIMLVLKRGGPGYSQSTREV